MHLGGGARGKGGEMKRGVCCCTEGRGGEGRVEFFVLRKRVILSIVVRLRYEV